MQSIWSVFRDSKLRDCSATFSGGKSVSHRCVLIGRQILAELCVDVCVASRRCLLQRAVQAGLPSSPASTAQAGSCSGLATVWTGFSSFVVSLRRRPGFYSSVAVPGAV